MSCEEEIRSLRKQNEEERSFYRTQIPKLSFLRSDDRPSDNLTAESVLFSTVTKDQRREPNLLALRQCFCLFWEICLIKFSGSFPYCTEQTKMPFVFKLFFFYFSYMFSLFQWQAIFLSEKKNKIFSQHVICTFVPALRYALVQKPYGDMYLL